MRKKCPIGRKSLDAVRLRAIKARKGGMKCKDIAKAYGISPVTISRWIAIYSEKGASGLKGRYSQGRPRKLDCEDIFKKLKKILVHPASDFGFPSPLWTVKRVCAVLDAKFKIKISHTTAWRRIKELGFSSQKPEKRAFQVNEIERNKWLKEVWPKIKRKAKKERAVILFEDEAAVSLIPSGGKTWAKIGRTPYYKNDWQ